MNATRSCRMDAAAYTLDKPEMIQPLMELCLEEHNQFGSRACWVLEYVFLDRPEPLYTILDTFIAGLKGVKCDSSVRPLAKICESMLKSYYTRSKGSQRPALTPYHKSVLTDICFDWLIRPGKVAPRVYSMQSLAFLGQEIKWINVELIAILEQQYHNGSRAYKARARQILKKLA